jgi:Zn-dependent peptidase ImmA (M78 family)
VTGSVAWQDGENAALALRQRLGLGNDAVDLEDVAALRDALIFRHAFGTTAPDGMYLYDGQEAMIVINASKPAQRQRFTLAHELGHHELHRVRGPMQLVDIDAPDSRGADGIKDPDEVAANAFAAHLLMPRAALEQALGTKRNRNVTVADLVDLVRRFRVSWEMTCWRLYNENLIRKVDREQLMEVNRTATLAQNGIDDRHYALHGPPVPTSLAVDAAQLWAQWHLTDERLAQILDVDVDTALAMMSTWNIEREDRGHDAAAAGEQALANAGIDLAAIAAAADASEADEDDE